MVVLSRPLFNSAAERPGAKEEAEWRTALLGPTGLGLKLLSPDGDIDRKNSLQCVSSLCVATSAFCWPLYLRIGCCAVDSWSPSVFSCLAGGEDSVNHLLTAIYEAGWKLNKDRGLEGNAYVTGSEFTLSCHRCAGT